MVKISKRNWEIKNIKKLKKRTLPAPFKITEMSYQIKATKCCFIGKMG